MMMTLRTGVAVATAGLLTLATQASAATETLNIAFEPGDGNENVNFVVDRNANEGIEIGIKAKERFIGELPFTGGAYQTVVGESPTSATDPTPDPGFGVWSFDFSIDAGSTGFGNTVGDYDAFLILDFNPAVGNTDLAVYDLNGLGAIPLQVYQQSWNLGFSFLSVPSVVPNSGGFDPFAAGEYQLGLTLAEKGTSNVLASVTTFVNVAPVPLPAGLPMALAGLGALWAIGRRRIAV